MTNGTRSTPCSSSWDCLPGSPCASPPRRVDQIDEMANVLVLPAATPLVHRGPERAGGLGIGDPQRAAGAEVTERARAGTERTLGHRQLESESEPGGALQTGAAAGP